MKRGCSKSPVVPPFLHHNRLEIGLQIVPPIGDTNGRFFKRWF